MPKHSLIIPGTIPSKKNNRQNFKGVSLASDRFKAWEKQAIARFKAELGVLEPPYVLLYEFFPPDLTEWDMSNAIEGINDCLVGRKLVKGARREYPLANDSMYWGGKPCLPLIIPILRQVSKADPRVEVTVWSGDTAAKVWNAAATFLEGAKLGFNV